MAYCVNCGVELEASLEKCPLCNTPVYHPVKEEKSKPASPYPGIRGEVARVKRTDLAILITVILTCTALGCGLLNLFIFQMNAWSLYIIGLCVVFWIFFIPAMIYRKLPFFLMLLFDGAAVAMYCGIIAYLFDGGEWYRLIALPIIIIGVVLIMAVNLCYRFLSRSILFMALAVVLALGIFCVGIDASIKNFITGAPGITWSAIVMICSLIIAVTLFTIMRISRLREEVRRRMHI